MIALMTGSSSSSYSRESISAGRGATGADGRAWGTAVVVDGIAPGGDGGGVNCRSAWTTRRIRFGLRGFSSGCWAGCLTDVGGVSAGTVDSMTLAECVVGEK
jgi:hypothetical protein